MRKRFEQQMSLGRLPITETNISIKSRDRLSKLAFAIVEMFKDSQTNERLFSLLEEKIIGNKKNTGRPGIDLWQIFVLAQFRLVGNFTYDHLHHMSNNDRMLRQLMGIESDSGFERIEIEYQNILDNLSLLNDELLLEINQIIVSFGYTNVFKKKEAEALNLKTDSFVVESNVHFPTDYNLLYDSARKSLDIIKYLAFTHSNITGWRKAADWQRELKIRMRIFGKINASGGVNKEDKLQEAAFNYLDKAMLLSDKLQANIAELEIVCVSQKDKKKLEKLKKFIEYLVKHIDLVERRIIKKEKIPHCEKIFSVFETYTEWINKGKQNPNVELGKKFAITTDQHHLIVDYQMMSNITDSEIVIGIADRILNKYKVGYWSFDKGFWNKDNKEILALEIEKVVMPKKGKCDKAELAEEKNTPV